MTAPAPTKSVRVFVNGTGLDLPATATALDAVRAADAAEGSAVAGGTRAISDSRGLLIKAAERVYAGAIYRTVRARTAVVTTDD
jgi:hypothetical protein